MNKLSEVDETINTEAKCASYGNREATINETKNEPTVKVYDAKDQTNFLIESTVDVRFGLLFNELKYNSCADFNNEYNMDSPSTFSANHSHNFGVGKSYMINNSIFYEENSFCNDKKYVEVGVYATKVQESSNDDSISSQEDQTVIEYETSSNEDTDEEDLTPLTFELKKDPEGYLINNKVYLTEFQWNTMVYNSNNDTIYCALCDKLITMPDMCDGHMSSVRHKLNLKKHKPLNKFPDSFIRLIRKQYHCGFCNKLFDKEDKDDHLSSRVHDITTEFARKKVTDKIKIKKVHKIGKYTFKMEENETAEVDSDDSCDVYFDEDRERQSICNGSVTTVSGDDECTTVSDSVNCDASANNDSVNVVMDADIDTAGRDVVIARSCSEFKSGNNIFSNGTDVESNGNDFAHSGNDNVAISDTDVVTNGIRDVLNRGSKVASSDSDVASCDNDVAISDNDVAISDNDVAISDNDVAISDNDFTSNDNNIASSDNDVADSGNDDVSSNTVVAVNSNNKTKSDSGIASSGNVVVVVDGSNKDKDIADKSSDKAIADKGSDKHTAGKSNNVWTVGQTVISEENKSHEIKPMGKFIVTKPKNFVQDFLMIEYKDKKIGLHFHSWHMLIKNSMGSLYCAICNLILPPKEVNSHCEEANHLKKLMSIAVIEEFSEYFVRRFDSIFYHCSHCNTMIDQSKMKSHLLTEHSKNGTKGIEDEQKNNNTITDAGNIDDPQNTDMGRKRKRGKKPSKLFAEHENNDQTDENINSQNQANYNIGGHNQANYNIGGHNQPNYNVGGHTQPNYNVGGHNQPNYNIVGHNQPNYNIGGHNQPNYNIVGHNQPNYNIGGHNQPNYNIGGHNQPNYNIGGYNQPNYNMNDPNHREYNAHHRQAWSPELHYEQMIGDIMVYKFGFLFKLKYLAYNVICRTMNTYYCGLCNQTIADEVALFNHVLSPYHRYCVEKTPYVVEFGLHLIRHIRGVFHCTLCNDPVNTFIIYQHTTSELHVFQLAAALSVPAERTRPPATLSTCILQTGVPSRSLLPIPRVSFIHLNSLSDPTRIQNLNAKSAGLASDLGPDFADQTSFVPPNLERKFNAFNPAPSLNVEPNIMSVRNNIPPNASMPQSQVDNVANTVANVDHLAKILLDAHRNPAHNETGSEQSFTINDPLSQLKKEKKNGPENPLEEPVSNESQKVNMMNTQNSAVGQNAALTKNNLILNETALQINTEVGVHNKIGSDDFEIQNKNDTIAYEILELDLLDRTKDCDIAQDSKSVESDLAPDETVPKKNIKTDGQEMSGSESYKPYNINATVMNDDENLPLNLLDQIKRSNASQCTTSEQNDASLNEETSTKNVEVGGQRQLRIARYIK